MLIASLAIAAQIAAGYPAVLIGAGDIGRCGSPGSAATAALVDSVVRADSTARMHVEVFTLGDNAYPGGSARDFARCFAPSWGDSTKAIMRHIRPAVGNHDLASAGSSYYRYFGDRAGPADKGYYSYNVGRWHVIVLNSAMAVSPAFSAADRKTQEAWLRDDVRRAHAPCTLAYWHHPRFSSGWHGSDPRLDPLWRILYAGGADLILNGHDHDYERFLPQTPDGVADSVSGITEIVAGTGGGELRSFVRAAPLSAKRVQDRFGVLKVTLGASDYSYAFLGVDHRILDQGGGKCH